MESITNYGLLLSEKDIKLHRMWFNEMAKLHGIKTVYRATRPDKHWTVYTEIESNYYEPEIVWGIFNETPDQKTMKKLGWFVEGETQPSIISVPYDTKALQVGCLFIIPSAYDCTKGRLFRVSQLSAIPIYPASVTCELVPEYEDTTSTSNINTYKHTSFNLLNGEEDNM